VAAGGGEKEEEEEKVGGEGGGVDVRGDDTSEKRGNMDGEG
jgi:hypothetical protein